MIYSHSKYLLCLFSGWRHLRNISPTSCSVFKTSIYKRSVRVWFVFKQVLNKFFFCFCLKFLFLCYYLKVKAQNHPIQQQRNSVKQTKQDLGFSFSFFSSSTVEADSEKRHSGLPEVEPAFSTTDSSPDNACLLTSVLAGALFAPRREIFPACIFAFCSPIVPLTAHCFSLLPPAPVCAVPKCATAMSRWFPETPGPPGHSWPPLALGSGLTPILPGRRCCISPSSLTNTAPEARSARLFVCLRFCDTKHTHTNKTEIRF